MERRCGVDTHHRVHTPVYLDTCRCKSWGSVNSQPACSATWKDYQFSQSMKFKTKQALPQNLILIHFQMELKTEDQLVPIQTPQSEVKKGRGRPRKTPKVVSRGFLSTTWLFLLLKKLTYNLLARYNCRMKIIILLGKKVMTLSNLYPKLITVKILRALR